VETRVYCICLIYMAIWSCGSNRKVLLFYASAGPMGRSAIAAAVGGVKFYCPTAVSGSGMRLWWFLLWIWVVSGGSGWIPG